MSDCTCTVTKYERQESRDCRVHFPPEVKVTEVVGHLLRDDTGINDWPVWLLDGQPLGTLFPPQAFPEFPSPGPGPRGRFKVTVEFTPEEG